MHQYVSSCLTCHGYLIRQLQMLQVNECVPKSMVQLKKHAVVSQMGHAGSSQEALPHEALLEGVGLLALALQAASRAQIQQRCSSACCYGTAAAMLLSSLLACNPMEYGSAKALPTAHSSSHPVGDNAGISSVAK